MNTFITVFLKELNDIRRDTRALITVSLVSILAGPILLLMISNMLSGFEARSEQRIIVISGIEYAPSLASHLSRETATIEEAPKDYEQALLTGRLNDPVLVIPKDFEDKWQKGEPQTLNLITHSGNSRANAGVSRVKRWVGSIVSERANIQLALNNVSPNINDFLAIEDIDLANPSAETTKIFGMLPYFFVLAALYGVWGSAIESTIGEKEHHTIEALLLSIGSIKALVYGKWFAIVAVGCIISALAIMSFIPAQSWMQSDTLKAMFSFSWYEVSLCLAMVIPLVGFFAAALMLVGAISKTTRQAQTNATLILMMTAFVPMILSMQANQTHGISQYLPVTAQHYWIIKLLEGENISVIILSTIILLHLFMTYLILKLIKLNIGKNK